MDNFTGNNTGADQVTGAYADIQATDVVNGGTGTGDQLSVTTAATALSFVAAANAGGVTNFEKLVLGNFTNTVTLNTAIVNSTAATNNRWDTITGGTGYDTIVVNAAEQVVNLSTVTGIEQFNIANLGAANAGAATAVQFITAGAGANGLILNQGGANAATTADTFDIQFGNFVNTATLIGNSGTAAVTTLITGGNTTDTITISGGKAANVYNLNSVETLNGSAAGGTYAFTAGTATSSTFNSAVNTGAQTITSAATADTINLSSSASATGANTITATAAASTFGAIDTLVNFNGTRDAFNVATAAVSLNSLTIASADSANLAAAIQTAIGGVTVTANAAYIITVNGGTAAGTYAYQNIAGTTVTTDDYIVKLVGASNITVGDFV